MEENKTSNTHKNNDKKNINKTNNKEHNTKTKKNTNNSRSKKPKKINDKKQNNKGNIKIIPLGGIGEIGANITVLEYENDIIVVDCGLQL